MPRLAISDALLDKYDTSAPRYTSYPPIPYWPAVTEEERQNWNDDEFEQLRITAGGNGDLTERSKQMVELQEMLSERVGGLFLWQQVQNQLHRPYLKGSWREKNAAGWAGLQFPNWNPGFGVQNIYKVYGGDNVKDFNRPGF